MSSDLLLISGDFTIHFDVPTEVDSNGLEIFWVLWDCHNM